MTMQRKDNFMTEAFERFSYTLMEKQEKLLREYIQGFADENNVSFECAKAFIKKYMMIIFDIQEKDGKDYLTIRGEFKPIEEVLADNSIDVDLECEKELWGNQ